MFTIWNTVTTAMVVIVANWTAGVTAVTAATILTHAIAIVAGAKATTKATTKLTCTGNAVAIATRCAAIADGATVASMTVGGRVVSIVTFM